VELYTVCEKYWHKNLQISAFYNNNNTKINKLKNKHGVKNYTYNNAISAQCVTK